MLGKPPGIERWVGAFIYINNINMTIQQRLQQPTPKFFRKLRNIGLIIAAIGGTLLTTPVALPALILKIAGYLAVAGTVASTVSQTATEAESEKGEEREPSIGN